MKLYLLSLVLLLSSLAWAQAASQKSFVLCRNKKIVRTIRVEKDKEAEKFVTIYTKSGVDRVVGEAQWFESAYNILSNIKGNLEGAGWTCSEHEQFRVLESDSLE